MTTTQTLAAGATSVSFTGLSAGTGLHGQHREQLRGWGYLQRSYHYLHHDGRSVQRTHGPNVHGDYQQFGYGQLHGQWFGGQWLHGNDFAGDHDAEPGGRSYFSELHRPDFGHGLHGFDCKQMHWRGNLQRGTTTFTTTSVCAAPTALSSSAITASSATVSFTGSGSATGYTVTTSPVTPRRPWPPAQRR